MIIISDTSAITSLVQIRREKILSSLYEQVVIPAEVAVELKKFHAALPGFIQVAAVENRQCFQRLCAEVDPGEAAAIALMLEGKGDLLLIDERRGRHVALREGLAIVGVLGVLLAARRRGLIDSLTDTLTELENTAGFRVSMQLKARAIAAAGE
jgi:hypothetical protein